ncbi:hypothetical protein V2J09_004318 [Rumex salicifolius]
MSELALIGADIQEVIGSAIAIQILSRGVLPHWAGASKQQDPGWTLPGFHFQDSRSHSGDCRQFFNWWSKFYEQLLYKLACE